MIKIFSRDKKVYATADNWQDLSGDEERFFRQCKRYFVSWQGFEGGDLRLELYERKQHREIDNKKQLKLLMIQVRDANLFRKVVEIDDTFQAFYEETEQLAAKEEIEREREQIFAAQVADWNRKIQKANWRLRNGCSLCEHVRAKNGSCICSAVDKPCHYKTDDIEREFYARRESSVTGLEVEFYATPYPCAGCPKVIEGRRALEEKTAFLEAQKETQKEEENY